MANRVLIQGSIVRGAYGFFALLLPKLLFGSVGVKEDEVDREARYFNRLFGGRDLLIAGATVAAVRRGAAREAVIANVLCEFTDSVSVAEEIRVRRGLDRNTIIGLVFNTAGYLTWLRALRLLKRAEAPASEPA